MQIQDVIRAAIPDADENLCEHVIWGRTPYPCRALSAKDIYRAAHRLKRATDAGRRLCDWCDRLAVQGSICNTCRSALRSNEGSAGTLTQGRSS